MRSKEQEDQQEHKTWEQELPLPQVPRESDRGLPSDKPKPLPLEPKELEQGPPAEGWGRVRTW